MRTFKGRRKRRTRRNDMMAIAQWLFEHFDVVEITEKREAYEAGAVLSRRGLATVLDLPRREPDMVTGGWRHAEEELTYVDGLIRDLPDFMQGLRVSQLASTPAVV